MKYGAHHYSIAKENLRVSPINHTEFYIQLKLKVLWRGVISLSVVDVQTTPIIISC